ncbi:MAG TPA: heme-binding domain-containing protein, partial [Chitinophagaceae bacterium]|nr:heme-binding domain-containing protein [Chitinophagaceae bacterium]
KGKSKLNFSEFGSLFKEKAIEKLENIEEVMKKNTMPLTSYKWYNKNADLTIEQREMISKWAINLSKQIASDSTAALNADSLPVKPL